MEVYHIGVYHDRNLAENELDCVEYNIKSYHKYLTIFLCKLKLEI